VDTPLLRFDIPRLNRVHGVHGEPLLISFARIPLGFLQRVQPKIAIN
jgi:hypothetical protein